MKKISIIIPIFNEEKTILEILKKVNISKSKDVSYEIICVNDCSNDNTLGILKTSGVELYDILIDNKINLGKGGSIIEGLKKSTGDFIIFQDADLEYDPNDIKKFIFVINNFDVDIILGSRFNFDRYSKSHNYLNRIGNILITFLFNVIYNTTFTDIYCCYFCFKKSLININELKSSGFEQQAEILAKCVKKSKNFYEVPVNYNGRSIAEGKKNKILSYFSNNFSDN